jgi:polyphosphate kinase 2 (PPK2 family)
VRENTPVTKKKYLEKMRIDPGEPVNLTRVDTGGIPGRDQKTAGRETGKEPAEDLLEASRVTLAQSQEILWASNVYSILLILQGMDTAGKEGIIRHVMSGMNPHGCQVSHVLCTE